MSQNQTPHIGDIVIYKPGPSDSPFLKNNKPAELPAIIVSIHNEKCLNLKVFTDCHNDVWVTSVIFGFGGYQWHWPENARKG